MKFRWNGLVATAFAALAATPAMAILPESGMWSIGQELNGKPGRGIQIDRQGGSTVIVTYFGYRADGSALFLQSAGLLQQGKRFDGVLTEFRNGRVLGGQASDGEIAREAGPIQIVFDSNTTATVTLPGEAPQRLQRFQFEDLRHRLNRNFDFTSSSDMSTPPNLGTIAIKAGVNTLTMSQEFGNFSGSCQYSGDLTYAGDGFHSKGQARCTQDGSVTDSAYEAKQLKVDEFGTLSARIYWGSPNNPVSETSRTYITGSCKHDGAVFAAIPYPRCMPDSLQVDRDLQRE